MNRSVRNNISKETRRTVAAIRQNAFELSSALESEKSEEEAKLDIMPKSLSGSSKVGDMEDAVAMFNKALKLISSGLDSINDASKTLGVEVDYKPSARLEKELLSTGRKGIRFQMLLPEAMMSELRVVSESSGVSKNEIICRALKEYLSDIDHK